MTSGNALNLYCSARRVIRVARLGIIGGSLKPFFGSCVPAVTGVICQPSSGRMCVFLTLAQVGCLGAYGHGNTR